MTSSTASFPKRRVALVALLIVPLLLATPMFAPSTAAPLPSTVPWYRAQPGIAAAVEAQHRTCMN
ncbi:MAG: hypothetical protein KatS3mg058_4000 [Roseiflexus sp.]|nr:MAG: hypothetical protein KatS3mg058_4000 [Roseiflexus sp.]